MGNVNNTASIKEFALVIKYLPVKKTKNKQTKTPGLGGVHC